MTTVQCLLNIAVVNNWDLYQLDVNNAFLYGDLDEDVYMSLPLWVNIVEEIDKFKLFLSSKFLIKDLGILKYFLGIEVLRTQYGICLSERKHCLELLAKFGVLGCKHAQTPLEAGFVLNTECTQSDKALENINKYQKLIGKLIYLTLTRPDIAYSVHLLSQFMHSPLQSHLKCALRLLRYLKGAPGLGVHNSKTCDVELKAYVDSDWGKASMIRKSVTGYCVFLNGSLVSWKSKKQATISRSSVEAEYRALADVTCEIIWILKLLVELEYKVVLPVEVFVDNKAAIKIASNPVFHEKTKHFEIDLHFVREKLSAGVIDVLKIESANNVADLFTKRLSGPQHRVCRSCCWWLQSWIMGAFMVAVKVQVATVASSCCLVKA
ncbi:uncharacterized mitochondrial protein AtMg00810-like [Rutidosis leptorrhynchoides]|uniref:uncharacterized mitochondrial protein AtMg00810-like n=1 Tax=Rutidosis leptorrhynchoides TaxID=125765 RepID=UPI003A9A34DF